jgi:CHAT domain-containing protein
MDESLLAYPWELMHDGEDFLCLRHNVGRFVNGTSQNFDLNRPPGLYSRPFDKLKVLLIVVSKPEPRDGDNYEHLIAAEDEAKEIADILGEDDGIDLEVMNGRDATFLKVSMRLSKGDYQILHFCGHAKFNDKNQRASSLVLYDRDLTTNAVYGLVLRKPPAPVLCFINACETAKPASERDQFNVFGLARAFLETGTYLLGTRWKVNDTAARYFAPQFYSSLLIENKPLGWAIRAARQACKDAAPVDDFAWASYILYGDPRVIFNRVPE